MMSPRAGYPILKGDSLAERDGQWGIQRGFCNPRVPEAEARPRKQQREVALAASLPESSVTCHLLLSQLK